MIFAVIDDETDVIDDPASTQYAAVRDVRLHVVLDQDSSIVPDNVLVGCEEPDTSLLQTIECLCVAAPCAGIGIVIVDIANVDDGLHVTMRYLY